MEYELAFKKCFGQIYCKMLVVYIIFISTEFMAKIWYGILNCKQLYIVEGILTNVYGTDGIPHIARINHMCYLYSSAQ